VVALIVHSSDPVALVGGADLGPQDLNILQSYAPSFVGVDGGADHLLTAGIRPVAVIGDLDSISDGARLEYSDLLHHVCEQDTVDFEKAWRLVDAPIVFAVGFSGGRLDHTLAVLNVMGRFGGRRLILIGTEDVTAIVPRDGIVLNGLGTGSRLSLMPLATARVSATGMRWPVDDQVFDTLRFTSPSNEVVGPVVTLSAEGPVLLVLPRRSLDAMVKAMMG
jgi:thiamine pyrophosphokinase|tara:strand:- start:2060 stop:2722 length:663 start_codon:yes stop_codon:yes gene_type:complete